MHAAKAGNIKSFSNKFYHDPTIKDNNGCTVAMHAAKSKYIMSLPREFYHDPTI